MNHILPNLIYIIPIWAMVWYWWSSYRALRTLRTMVPPALSDGSNFNKSTLVVIPFCNEVAHLPGLLSDLGKLKLPQGDITFVLVNDHSSDHGEVYLASRLPGHLSIHLIHSSYLPGKKSAIQFALDSFESELFCTLDADVRIPSSWLANMLANYEYSEPSLVIGQVKMNFEPQWMRRLQFTEWFLLQGLTMSTALNQKPIMCNGASLLFDRNSFEKKGGYSSHVHLASGDDYYSLLQMKSFGEYSIKLQCESTSAVEIHPMRKWKELWRQRLRWSKKKKLLSDPHIRTWGIIITGANFSLLFCAFASPFVPFMTHLYFVLLGFKCMADHGVAEWVAKNRNQKLVELDLVMLNMLYPFFMVAIAVASPFCRPPWKHKQAA